MDRKESRRVCKLSLQFIKKKTKIVFLLSANLLQEEEKKNTTKEHFNLY